MAETLIFDQEPYLKIIDARGRFIRRVVPELASALNLRTALDAGCGVGFFAKVLQECGFEVEAFDGRESNTIEAATRYPSIKFHTADVEDKSMDLLGRFDLVLCFGLLYHLENPMMAIRNLRRLTSEVLVLETMCLPSGQMVVEPRSEPNKPDQSLTDLAFYASESCIVKMLYRAGFTYVYGMTPLPNHDDFRETGAHFRRRTVLAATMRQIGLRGFRVLPEPQTLNDFWAKLPTAPWHLRRRARRFFNMSLGERAAALRRRLPILRRTVRLDYGAKWYIREDHVSQPILHGGFEPMEISFEQRFLQPRMTVLDIGAHHGYHTLLASLRVGTEGKVFAFEPSDRERRALLKNLSINRCRNVTVEALALGAEEKSAELHVVSGVETGCNSLARPNASGSTSTQTVRVKTLDEWLQSRGIDRVDFVKLDVEGGERDVLNGAERLVTGQHRPVILAEVQEVRTSPWGYEAKVIINHLSQRGYTWFSLMPGGFLAPLNIFAEEYDGNFVACPAERLSELAGTVALDAGMTSRYETVWVDVGAHLGEKTLEAAVHNPKLLVFAFEPNWTVARRIMGRAPNFVVLPMAVSESDGYADFLINSNEESSSLAVMEESGLAHWSDIDLSVAEKRVVPTIRLDTFMRLAGLKQIDYLKVDAEGLDLKVVRSAGERLKDIGKVMLEVDVAPDLLYRGAPTRGDVEDFMTVNGFALTASETQSSGRQENLTFSTAVGKACQSSR